MPYIKQDKRELLARREIASTTEGELNYVLTDIVREYFIINGKNYAAINAVLGALEGCKLEFYRRIAAPYEDKKIEENGDVY